jgi:hypothetical protein
MTQWTFLVITRLRMGNFYYDCRQNPISAMMYYQNVLQIAPNSDAAQIAKLRMDEIAEGKHGKGTPIDFLLGRYRPAIERRQVTQRSYEEVVPDPRRKNRILI